MKILRVVLAIGAMFIASTGSSRADQMWVTWTGYANGYDSGYFGGGTLSNAAFVSKYLFDTNAPGAYSYTSGVEDSTYGGSYFSNANPALFASLMINASTFSFTPSSFGQDYTHNDGSFFQLYSDARGANIYEYLINYVYGYGPSSVPTSLETPYSAAVSTITNVNGNYGYFTFGGSSLTFSNASVSVVSAVPEPETYAMLLAGLGLLGFAARRRKSKQAAAV